MTVNMVNMCMYFIANMVKETGELYLAYRDVNKLLGYSELFHRFIEHKINDRKK